MQRATPLRKRPALALAALVIAAIGPGPLIAGPPTANFGPDQLAALAGSATAGTVTLATAPDQHTPHLIIEARTETWAKYLDLAIRVLSLVLAWLLGKEKNQTAPANRR